MKRFLKKRNARRALNQWQALLAEEAMGHWQPRLEYSYKPINEDRHIRLFLLCTMHDAVDREVRGRLVAKPLEAAKDDYIAISYVLGGEDLSKNIVIEEDGEEFEIMITENLHAALTEIAIVMKKIRKNAFVWADGICINQRDKDDKT